MCDLWKNDYTQFYDWMWSNWYDYDGVLEIDKDILVFGNRVYGPNTCLLVPLTLNRLISGFGNLKPDIKKTEDGYRINIRDAETGKLIPFIGLNEDECKTAYINNLKDRLMMSVEHERNKIPDEVADAVLDYPVERILF